MAPFRAIQDWLKDAISGDDSFRSDQGNVIVRFITLPFRLLWGFLVFMVQAWTTSRNGIAFLRGLPAFGIIAFTPFLLWLVNNYSRQISVGPTIGYHKMHLRNGADEYAQLFSKKLVELEPESKEYKYMMAEDYARNGDIGKATRIMEFLAGSTDITPTALVSSPEPTDTGNPLDPPTTDDSSDPDVDAAAESAEPEKYAQAHVWLSQQLIRKQRMEGMDEAGNTKAMAHLRAAIAADPENIRAKVNLVDLYLTRARSMGPDSGEYKEEEYIENLKLARESLEALTRFQNFNRMEQVLAMPQLVDVCVKLGDDAAAKRALNDAASKVTRIARLNPEIYEIWFSLVQCAVALKDYKRADEFIKTGYQNVKTQETRRKIMQLSSLVFIQNADDFKDITIERNFRLRLFALCKAIATNPRDVKIYDRLEDYIDVDVDEAQREVWLRNSILDCPIPGVVHILIGTRELIRGDVVAGKTSWDIAQHQFGTTEFVIHRLLSIAIRKEPKYGEGDLLNTALLLFPDQYMLYETRGAIKKGRGEFTEAIKDFEFVIDKVPDLITVQKHLADCYEAIGNAEKASFHESRVEELLDQVDQKQRDLYERELNKL
ncbi:tetratricopeptide repeat protein [Mariniblastus fucicola]|nr:tetratricopeptide repeat protein [Mariniblastus fucicola]